MSSRLRIAVTGLAATYPMGGVFWDYLQYVLGFHRLGHDCLYIEDTGQWCYDPAAQTFVEGGQANATLLAAQLARLDPTMVDRWFFRDATGRTFGRPWPAVVEFCRTADLFLHISASCWMRDEYFAARRTAFLDSDPMYTQASVPDYVHSEIDPKAKERVEVIRRHDVFFTFAENIASPDCRVPRQLFNWIPTRQPIVLDCFEPHIVPISSRRQLLTTVASWEPTEKGPTINGVRYCGKSAEFQRFLTMPRHSALPLEVAMAGSAPLDDLKSHGWLIRPAAEVSCDPWVYRQYLANSLGEFSVAKNAYVAGRTGWFSCRTACYLALGVPAIVQDTGFSHAIPCGEGIISFQTLPEAAAAIQSIKDDPSRHSRAALQIAREYFDSAKVLTQMIEKCS